MSEQQQKLTGRILLVDDDGTSLFCLQMILTEEGHTVDTASDVQSALASAAAMVPDMVVTDIGLPDGNGSDLYKELYRRYRIPGIALTGYNAPSVADGSEITFTAHVTKPVEFDSLSALIQKILRELRRSNL